MTLGKPTEDRERQTEREQEQNVCETKKPAQMGARRAAPQSNETAESNMYAMLLAR
jgi:hypothetical protein